MEKTLLLLCSVLVVVSCGSNDDTPLADNECAGIADYLPPGKFLIELVDSKGINLIENGFYDWNRIVTKLNNEDFNYHTLTSREPSELDNLITIVPIGNEGNNRWLLTLSETDVDTLDFSMSNIELDYMSDGLLYCGNRFLLNSANYNGETINFEESTADTYLEIPIKVIKTTD